MWKQVAGAVVAGLVVILIVAASEALTGGWLVRALGGVASADLDQAEERLADSVDEKIATAVEAVDGRFELADGRFELADGRFEAVDNRFDRLEPVNGRFDRLELMVTRTEHGCGPPTPPRCPAEDGWIDNDVRFQNTFSGGSCGRGDQYRICIRVAPE